MIQLHPFKPTARAGNVQAELAFPSTGTLTLRFEWERTWVLSHAPAAAELWKGSCLEAFLKPVGADSYWEINVSPDGRWNVYAFESYRNPQPPRKAPDWELTRVDSKPGRITAEFRCPIPPGTRLAAGLSSVFQFSDGPASHEPAFFALGHSAAKPDFHDARSFLIERTMP